MKLFPKWVLIPGVALAVGPACNKQPARTEHPITTNPGTAREITGPTNLQVAGVVFDVGRYLLPFVEATICGTNLQDIQRSETDSNGHFVFKHLSPGPLTVEAGPDASGHMETNEQGSVICVINPRDPYRIGSAGA
ncbi:MAG: hypothetical protein ABSA47_14960 [Verrucomicrobiota bacterium]|jgi:hypothetical protein